MRTALALAASLTALSLAACQRPASPPAPPVAPSQAPAAGAAPAAAAPVGSPAAAGEARPFEVSLVPPAVVRRGEAATARVVITAKGAYHVNKDYPLAFRPEPGSTAAFGAERIPLGEKAERTPCAAHAEDACSVAAPLPFTLAAAGPATLAGTVAFSVCTAEICLIEKAPLTMAVVAR